jgi:hypothetical protein
MLKSPLADTTYAQRSRQHGTGRRIARFALALLLILVLAALGGWSVLALYFGNSHTTALQTLLAARPGWPAARRYSACCTRDGDSAAAQQSSYCLSRYCSGG